jgi:hypothetical protein
LVFEVIAACIYLFLLGRELSQLPERFKNIRFWLKNETQKVHAEAEEDKYDHKKGPDDVESVREDQSEPDHHSRVFEPEESADDDEYSPDEYWVYDILDWALIILLTSWFILRLIYVRKCRVSKRTGDESALHCVLCSYYFTLMLFLLYC